MRPVHLHPDKHLALSQLLTKRSKKKALPTPKKSYGVSGKKAAQPASGNLIENLAFRMREGAMQRHFDKLKNGV